MDIFQHRYYRLGKMLMLLTGQWPYQSMFTRYGILAVVILFIAYQMVAQILAVVRYRDDWNILLQCFVPNAFDAVCISKYLCFRCNSQKISKLLDRIPMDWHVWARHQEVKILHEYANWGRNITMAYIGKSSILKGCLNLANIFLSILHTVMMYSGLFVFMIQPMIRKLIDVVLNNNTEPGTFLFPVVYYHLDVQKYYLYLSMYITVCALIIVTPLASSEVLLIIYVQHVCGIFAAVGHKIEGIGSNDTSTKKGESPYAVIKAVRLYLASCIERHNDAIEFAELIKASYAWNFFFSIVFGMILINASGLQMIVRTNDIGESLTFTVLSLATIISFYIECSISQMLIDHSISIRSYIQNSQWYRLPPKSQKIVQLITMSCNVPCHLTAGDMVIMSLQTFGLTMRTAMSYFAFMRSTQGI